jgi:hypothetical protein
VITSTAIRASEPHHRNLATIREEFTLPAERARSAAGPWLLGDVFCDDKPFDGAVSQAPVPVRQEGETFERGT